MSEKADKRSGMLGTIYNMLPSIDDDYAAKLVYTLENKKSLPENIRQGTLREVPPCHGNRLLFPAQLSDNGAAAFFYTARGIKKRTLG